MRKSKLAQILLFGWLIFLIILHIYQDPPIGSVEGYVYDRATSKPLASAKVYSMGVTYKNVETNDKGHFKITGLVEGSYTIKAVKKGFDPSWAYDCRIKEKGAVPSLNFMLAEALPRFYIYSSKKIYAPSDKKYITLRGYNVDHAYLSIYKIDIESYVNKVSSIQNLNKIPLEEVQFIKKWDIDLSQEEDWTNKETEIPVNETGVYLIKSWVKNPKNLKLEDALWVNVTNLGLITKQSKTKLLLWAVNFKNHKPFQGVNVKVFNNNQKETEGSTNENGVFQKEGYDLKDNFVFAKAGNSYAFNYSSQSYYSNYKHNAYIYTERPIYRPNQTVYFKGIIRGIGDDGEYKLSPNEPVEVKIFDPKDNVVYEKTINTNDWGSINDNFVLDEEPALGNYSIVFNINDEEYYGRFKVEEYRKPEFKVEVKSEKETYIAGDKLKAKVNVSYYFGQPVTGAKVKYTVFSSYYYLWDFEEDYNDYFEEGNDEEYGYGYGKVISEGEIKTNADGIAEISVDTEKLGENRQYTVEVEVTDESERTVSETGSAIVMAGEFDLLLDSRSYVNDLNSTVNVTIEAKDVNKKSISTDFEYEVIRSESYYKNGKWESKEHRVFKGKDKTKSNGKCDISFKVNKGGDYYFRVRSKDKLGNEINRELWFWVIDAKESYYSNRNELKIQLDKPKYVPGQTAKAMITATEPDSYVLFTIEGKELYQSWILYLKGNSKVVKVPILDNNVPGIYFVASYVSRDNQFISEERKVKVAKESKEIKVLIKPNKQKYLPNEKAAYLIQTTNYNGKPISSEVSLSVVDEAIYAIQPEMAGNIIDEFYGQVNNMVSTSYSFGTGYTGGISKFESSKVRKKFKDTAFWQANVYTNNQGLASVSFDFPENLTTWRATARAHTKNNLFGSATQQVIVSKPLIARLELPRFFLTRDNFAITTVIHNYSLKAQNVKVKLKLEGISFSDNGFYKEKVVSIQKKSSQKLLWNINIVNPGTAKVVLWAGNDEVSDGMELEIPIFSHGVKKIKYLSNSILDNQNVTTDSKTLSISIDNLADMKTVSGVLRICPTVASSLFSALDYLVGYPYGCVEQTMSKVMPNVFVFKALKDLGIKNEKLESRLPYYIKKGVKRLISYRHDDGGWGWWKNDETEPFMTAYALYGLLISKNIGAEIPLYILNDGLKSLEKQISTFDEKIKKSTEGSKNYLLEDKAFMLYVLSNFRKVTVEEISILYESRQKLNSKTLAILAITLKRSGYENRAREVNEILKTKAVIDQNYCYWKEYSQYSYYNDNDMNIEATAYSLLSLLNLDPENNNIDKIVSWLMSQRDGDHWVSTKTTSITIQAFVEYIKIKAKSSPPNYKAHVWINNKYIATVDVNETNVFQSDREIKLIKNYFKLGQNFIRIEKKGNGDIYYSLDLGYFGREEDIKEKSTKDLLIKREYFKKVIKENPESEELVFDYNALGSTMKLGDLIETRITIKNKYPLRYLIIEDPLLCGGEVLMDRAHDEWIYWFANREVRDEKVSFFITYLEPGEHVLEYEMRPELTGDFHIMPAILTGMYEPGIYVYTKENKFRIVR